LCRLMRVRRSGLDRMGEGTIRKGAPLATLEEPLVPIFMYHRYTVESAASMVAGQDFIYGMRGDQRTPTRGVSVDDQRKALDALALTLKPSELTIPKRVLDLIPPRPPGYGMHRELFPRTTGDTFDPLSPATIAADVTIGFVLQLDRAARMPRGRNQALPRAARRSGEDDPGRRRAAGCADRRPGRGLARAAAMVQPHAGAV